MNETEETGNFSINFKDISILGKIIGVSLVIAGYIAGFKIIMANIYPINMIGTMLIILSVVFTIIIIFNILKCFWLFKGA